LQSVYYQFTPNALKQDTTNLLETVTITVNATANATYPNANADVYVSDITNTGLSPSAPPPAPFDWDNSTTNPSVVYISAALVIVCDWYRCARVSCYDCGMQANDNNFWHQSGVYLIKVNAFSLCTCHRALILVRR
jgi:hypothetical protein